MRQPEDLDQPLGVVDRNGDGAAIPYVKAWNPFRRGVVHRMKGVVWNHLASGDGMTFEFSGDESDTIGDQHSVAIDRDPDGVEIKGDTETTDYADPSQPFEGVCGGIYEKCETDTATKTDDRVTQTFELF